MGLLPQIRRFSLEDFPSETSWIGNLFLPLNQILTTLYSNLSNGLTLSQNLLGQVKAVPVSGTTGVVSFPYQFSPATPIGVLVINTVQTDTPIVAITTAIGCTWTYNSGVLTVTVQGLTTGHTYNVTFWVIGG